MSNNQIAIYGSRRQEAFADIEKFFAFLEQEGFRIYVYPAFGSYLESAGVSIGSAVPSEHVPPGVSLVISLGGDGTFLRTAAWVGSREIPILGVNTGHLGYLSACGLDEAPALIADISRGRIKVERRMVLEVSCSQMPENGLRYALNEVTVHRDESASVVAVKAWINAEPLADYMADGLIVCTPTGSTAYNLSAGGPILEPSVNCMAVTPIAPHTLTLRPLVVDGDSLISLKAESRSNQFRLSIDNKSYLIKSEALVEIKKAPYEIFIIRKNTSCFAGILREKLLWNA